MKKLNELPADEVAKKVTTEAFDTRRLRVHVFEEVCLSDLCYNRALVVGSLKDEDLPYPVVWAALKLDAPYRERVTGGPAIEVEFIQTTSTCLRNLYATELLCAIRDWFRDYDVHADPITDASHDFCWKAPQGPGRGRFGNFENPMYIAIREDAEAEQMWKEFDERLENHVRPETEDEELE